MDTLYDRLRNKVRSTGVSGAAAAVWRKYLEPALGRALYPNLERSFDLETTPVVCIPVVEEADQAFVAGELRWLEEHFPSDRDLVVRVPHMRAVPITLPPARVRADEVVFDDPLRFTDFVVNHRHLVVAPDGAPEKQRLLGALEKLRIAAAPSASALVGEQLGERLPVLRGPLRQIAPTVGQLMARTGSGHYSYVEPIDWSIVAELPRKFAHLSRTATIRARPQNDLGNTRVDRQYAVGRIYGPTYFQGESLLDVCCDLGGIRRSVGPATRYVGVDFQGLADHCVDLNRDELPFPDASFESVLCFEALEHLASIHQALDKMLRVSRRYFVGSLYCEPANTGGRSMTRAGEAIGNAHLPIAPVFDRHHWIFTFSDALDFIYYRARRSGFRVVQLDLFHFNGLSDLLDGWKDATIERRFAAGDVPYLSRNVTLVGFALERERATNGH